MKKTITNIVCIVGLMAILIGIVYARRLHELKAKEVVEMPVVEAEVIEPTQPETIDEIDVEPEPEIEIEIQEETEETNKPSCVDDPLMTRHLVALAKTVLGEAGCCPPNEQEFVICTVLNRVDDERFPNDIFSVCTAENQFHGYNPEWGIRDDIWYLCIDVVDRWLAGEELPLPKDILYFYGDGRQNHFYNRDGDYFSYDGEVLGKNYF